MCKVLLNQTNGYEHNAHPHYIFNWLLMTTEQNKGNIILADYPCAFIETLT